MKNTKVYWLLLLPFLCSSCIKYKDLLSYNEAPGIPTNQAINNYQPVVIQPNDILQIRVSSTSDIAAAPFNTTEETGGFLVDNDGNVELPTLGTVQLAFLTLEEAKDTLRSILQPYFSERPIVNIRLQNFKINVNGEVGSPGIFSVPNGRMTMMEAITLAGDFTAYSRRDSILVVREFNGERTFGYIDFNSSEAFESPYFYLQQNDMVYIKPSKLKTTTVRDPASRVFPYISIATGLAAIVFSILRTR